MCVCVHLGVCVSCLKVLLSFNAHIENHSSDSVWPELIARQWAVPCSEYTALF